MINIKVTYDGDNWFYSALLKDFWISTQWKSLDELIFNIKEALCLYNKDNKIKINITENQFKSFDMLISA